MRGSTKEHLLQCKTIGSPNDHGHKNSALTFYTKGMFQTDGEALLVISDPATFRRNWEQRNGSLRKRFSRWKDLLNLYSVDSLAILSGSPCSPESLKSLGLDISDRTPFPKAIYQPSMDHLRVQTCNESRMARWIGWIEPGFDQICYHLNTVRACVEPVQALEMDLSQSTPFSDTGAIGPGSNAILFTSPPPFPIPPLSPPVFRATLADATSTFLHACEIRLSAHMVTCERRSGKGMSAEDYNS